MVEFSPWAQAHYDRIKDHPEYIASGLILGITDQLWLRMEELGISQRELARRMGCSQPFVWKLLNGTTKMNFKTLVTMAQALGLEVQPLTLVHHDQEVEEAVKRRAAPRTRKSSGNGKRQRHPK